MKRRVGLYIAIFIVLSVGVFAQSAPQPVAPISQTDRLIKEQHIATQAWCEQQWDIKLEEIENKIETESTGYLERIKNALWVDRIINFGSMLMAAFFGFTLRALFDLQFKKKKQFLDRQEAAYTPAEDLPTPPKPDDKTEQLEAIKDTKFHY